MSSKIPRVEPQGKRPRESRDRDDTPVGGRSGRGAAREVVAYIDGGARGNPGPAGYGVRIERADGRLLTEFWRPLGVATNNTAEYEGLLAALRYLLAQGVRRARIRSDSELLVRQLTGVYRVRHPRLRPLYAEARALADRFDRIAFEHIPREANRAADHLANLAMDEAERRLGG